MFLEKLVATEENLGRVAAVCRGETIVPPLDEHETLMLDAITNPHAMHKLGTVTLGKANIVAYSDTGNGPVPVGDVTEDFINYDGLWLRFAPL